MKFKEYINETNQVKYYINKFITKMKSSNIHAAIKWVDEIEELSPKEKEQVLKGIIKIRDKFELIKMDLKKIKWN